MTTLDQQGRDLLFNEAHTYIKWLDKPIANDTLHALYDLMKMAPTSANCSPLRVVFLSSEDSKQRLKPYLAEGNVEKTMAAPTCAILAMDTQFYEHLPQLFPHTDAKSWFVGNQQLIDDTAFRNSSLQAAYFILAARAVGLDCGPMSGYDAEKLDQDFFPDGRFKSNLLCNLGYGAPEGYHPRTPRLAFDEACQVL